MKEPKYTQEDLKTMQGWSLERKIQVTQLRIMEFYERLGGMVSVSISGGKDSMVLLDLARRVYPDIEAVYVNTGLDYPEVRRLAMGTPNVAVLRPKMRFNEAVKQYGWCYPSKDVAEKIYYAKKGSKWARNCLDGLNMDGTPSRWRQSHYAKWKYLIDAPFNISDKCCEVMKESPLNEFRRETGKYPIIGTMASEGGRRKQSWFNLGCNNFDSRYPSSKPMSFWTTQDVLSILDKFNCLQNIAPYTDAEIIEAICKTRHVCSHCGVSLKEMADLLLANETCVLR